MRLFFALLFVLFIGMTTYAQDKGAIMNRLPELLDQLELTPLQKEKVSDLRLKYKDLFEHNVRTMPDRRQRLEKRKLLQKDLRSEMKIILTPSQQHKLRELNRQARDENDHSRFLDDSKWNNVSSEQQAEIRTLLKSQREKVKEIRQSGVEGDELQSQLREVKSNTSLALQKILTKEQYENFDKRMKNKRRNPER